MFPHPRLIALRLPRTARAQHFSTSVVARKWEGRQPEENTTRETDKHNVQQDASRDGKEQRAKGEGGIAQTEKGGSCTFAPSAGRVGGSGHGIVLIGLYS